MHCRSRLYQAFECRVKKLTVKNDRNKPSVTLIDVARHAGVSPMTVSRVLNKLSIVKATTREKVLASVEALNYSPNQAARNLASGRSTRICLLYGNPSSAYLGELLVGALEAVSSVGHQLIVKRVPEDISAEDIRKDLYKSWDGVIIPAPMCDVQEIRDLIRDEAFPAVLLGRSESSDEAISLGIDDLKAAQDMTEHLLGLGHKNIGFVGGPPSHSSATKRKAGYEKAIKDADLDVRADLIVSGLFTYRSGMEAGEQLLSMEDPPTAIFASNDDMAAGVLAVAAEKGIKIPGDLSVVGFDDTLIATTVWPNLTTIRQPLTELAECSVKVLSDKIGGRVTENIKKKAHMLSYSLVTRDSSGPLKSKQ